MYKIRSSFYIQQILQQIANVDIRIFLSPREKLSEMPLKRLEFVFTFAINSVFPIFLEFEEFLEFQNKLFDKSEKFLREGGIDIFPNISPRILPQPVGNTAISNHPF